MRDEVALVWKVPCTMNLSQEKYNLIIGASIAKCSHQESNVSLVVQSESIVPNCNPTSVDDSELLRSDYTTYTDTSDCLVFFYSLLHPTVAHVQYNLVASFDPPCTIQSDDSFPPLHVRYQSQSHTYYDT